MLVLDVSVELGAVYSVGMAVVGCVGLLELQHLFPFDLVVDSYDWLASCGEEFGAVVGVVEAVELFVGGGGVILECGETFA